MRRPWPALGRSTAGRQIITIHHYVVFVHSDRFISVTIHNQTHAYMDFSRWWIDTIIPKILTFSLESSCISVPSYICALSPLSTLSAVPECCVFVTYKLSTISLHYSCYASCSQGARRVYRWVQDAGGSRGQRQLAVFGKKAQHISRRVCYSLPGWDICYLGLRLWNSNEQPTRDIR